MPFAEAVSDGNVVQRHWVSRLTGLERSVETSSRCRAAASGARSAAAAQMPTLDDDGTELRERRFLPYRR